MNKKISLGVAVMFMAIVASITFALTMLFSQEIFNSMIFNVSQRESMYDKIGEIDTLVRNNALNGVNEEVLLDAISTGIVTGLDDKYASYLTKDEYEQKLLEDRGELVGIGVSTSVDEESGYLKVLSVYENSPAQVEGVLAGDLIIKVEDVDIASIDSNEAISMIRGEEGTKVRITTRRDGIDTEYTIVRKKIETPSVFYKMIETKAYIQITEFNESTVGQFEQALEFVYANEATGIIFDLRNNGGGIVDSCTEMIDMLVPDGVIATTVDAKGESKVIARSDASQVNLPMVTITNENTASAAELFVMALKDFDKANSVGVKTYGKGVMQTTYALNDGSAVKITTAYLNPPSGQNYDAIGISPDYEVTITKEQEEKIDQEDYKTDPQLTKAFEVVNSKQ